MEKIELWINKKEKKIDCKLYSDKAEVLAKELADENRNDQKLNRKSQIRKFYKEILALDTETKTTKGEFEYEILPRLHLLIPKAVYAQGRKLVSDNFVNFLKSGIEQVYDPDDLKVLTNLFEAFIGFYQRYCLTN